jgi:hypothetical protein
VQSRTTTVIYSYFRIRAGVRTGDLLGLYIPENAVAVFKISAWNSCVTREIVNGY